jgi:signal transduction histidine kinase
MKKLLLFIYILFSARSSTAQERWAEKLREDATKKLDTAKETSTRFNLVSGIFNSYLLSYPDSAGPYAQDAMLLAQNMHSDTAIAMAYVQFARLGSITGEYPQALQYCLKGLETAERAKDIRWICRAYNQLSGLYSSQEDHERAILYAKRSKEIYETHFVPSFNPGRSKDSLQTYTYCLISLGTAYEKADQLDSALKYIQLVDRSARFLNQNWAFVPYIFGNIYSKMGEFPKAISYYRRALYTATRSDSKKDLLEICYGFASAFKNLNQLDSAIFYANKVLEINKSIRFFVVKTNTLELLANLYKKRNNSDSAAKYFEWAIAAKDSLFNQGKAVRMQNMTMNEQLRQQNISDEKKAQKKRITIYVLAGGLFLSIIVTLILNSLRLQKQKAKIKIERAYSDLKATQAQLIQSEKMASLGQLTAGIAHEIQNPLNFVTNFSEVNKELLQELKAEIEKGNVEEATALANDVIENQEKINEHGKRADSIVKGMLQHSRSSSGVKEPTNINALADEYLRLAYHGMRAKDKSFNATLKTSYDETIGNINIIPQDIGRVILNLITNAFYAVAEKKRNNPQDYQPTVTISTKLLKPPSGGWGALISVSDNGNGIPTKVLDKIFQPFFTTKPTGQGTGLGLSLSYDIIKAHGGELKVETKEGEGSIFRVQLPVA